VSCRSPLLVIVIGGQIHLAVQIVNVVLSNEPCINCVFCCDILDLPLSLSLVLELSQTNCTAVRALDGLNLQLDQ